MLSKISFSGMLFQQIKGHQYEAPGVTQNRLANHSIPNWYAISPGRWSDVFCVCSKDDAALKTMAATMDVPAIFFDDSQIPEKDARAFLSQRGQELDKQWTLKPGEEELVAQKPN